MASSDLSSRGQHTATPGPLPNSGQRQTQFDPNSRCGDLSGGQEHGGSRTRTPARDADISTTHHITPVVKPTRTTA
jgi:hypothetical protein